ncbi:hypothetical protein U9M48_017302 [Paspalum notatum var. saurae]|uniref:non-specific serine/threonine protein kinase n=1 Tax=Paspalum notatum var. saurae TaxID=547442 RepID=A0AAQ3WNQ1_PASNO
MAMSNRACALLLLLLPVAVLLLEQAALSSAADFPLGGQAAVQLPPAPYRPGFAARAVVLDAQGQRQPGFVAAVSTEAAAAAGRYTCSLVVLLGGVKVWASDHLDKFVARAMCRLELTEDGQLRLTDGAGNVGWLSGTAGQGVKVMNPAVISVVYTFCISHWHVRVQALHLDRKTGNLVLLDAQNRTRWQSLDDPTDTFLRGQQLTLPVYLIAPTTKLVSSASAFYSFELDGDKIATYVNFGETRYSYWELAPAGANRTTMASARLDGAGLRILDLRGATVAQITPPVKRPPLPLSCGLHEACSSAGKCKGFSAYADRPAARAGNASSDPCEGTAGDQVCMVHLRGVTTVLRAASPLANVTLRECVAQCARNLSCVAALYVKDNAGAAAAADRGVCSHYELTAGAREVIDGSRRYSYWVKFSEAGGGGGDDEDDDDDGSSSAMLGKILMICGAIDVVCAVMFAVLVALYFRRLRRLTAAVDSVVELQQGEAAESAGEQNDTDSDGAEQF